MSDDGEKRVVIDLNGLDLSEDERQKLEELLRRTLIDFLSAKSEPRANYVAALGPGWIGIEAV